MGKPCKKKRYRTEIDAKIALSRIDMRVRCKGQSAKAPTRAYKCHRCPHWHVTSEPLRVDK